MDFKEWFEIEEALKGLKRHLDRQLMADNPDMPKYVRDELTRNRVRPIANMAHQTKINPSTLFQMHQINLNWSQQPEILKGKNPQGITPADFDRGTQQKFIERCFGLKDQNVIPNDAQRTNQQRQLMSQRGSQNEPIIVGQSHQGYYLFEGWHRTMNYLLQGAPQDQLEMLKQLKNQQLDFRNWRPIQIQGYIGRPKTRFANINDIGGTGEFNPVPRQQQPPQFSQPARPTQA